MGTEESKISNAVEDLDRELEERLHTGKRRNRKPPRDKPREHGQEEHPARAHGAGDSDRICAPGACFHREQKGDDPL